MRGASSSLNSYITKVNPIIQIFKLLFISHILSATEQNKIQINHTQDPIQKWPKANALESNTKAEKKKRKKEKKKHKTQNQWITHN